MVTADISRLCNGFAMLRRIINWQIYYYYYLLLLLLFISQCLIDYGQNVLSSYFTAAQIYQATIKVELS